MVCTHDHSLKGDRLAAQDVQRQLSAARPPIQAQTPASFGTVHSPDGSVGDSLGHTFCVFYVAVVELWLLVS